VTGTVDLATKRVVGVVAEPTTFAIVNQDPTTIPATSKPAIAVLLALLLVTGAFVIGRLAVGAR
jgi:hypothetical protein